MQNGSAQSDFNSVTEWSHKLELEILHELLNWNEPQVVTLKKKQNKEKKKKMLYGMIVFCQLIVVSQYFIPAVKSLKGNLKIVYPSISNIQKGDAFVLTN